MQLASLFLMDKVDIWFYNWNRSREYAWEEFNKEICNRFRNDGLEDMMEKFMKLRQENSIEECRDEFEDIRIRLERLMQVGGILLPFWVY